MDARYFTKAQAASLFFDLFMMGYAFQPTDVPLVVFCGQATILVLGAAPACLIDGLSHMPQPKTASLSWANAVTASKLPPGFGEYPLLQSD